MNFVPGDNTRSYPAIRDYKINMLQTAGRQIGVQGNFLLLKNVSYKLDGFAENFSSDQEVTFLLNSSDRIKLRPGQTLLTQFNSIEVVDPVPLSAATTYECELAAGYGELKNYKPSVSGNIVTYDIPVLAGNVADLLGEFSLTSFNFRSIKEIRLLIDPATNAAGVYYKYANSSLSSNDGAYLPPGQTDWLDFAGNLLFTNNSAATVTLNVALVLW